MTTRRKSTLLASSSWIVLAWGLFALPPSPLPAPSAWAIGAKSANLQQTLEAGLKARRPEEFAFIQRVINQVDSGDLPIDLVRGTFDWARKKRPFPYVYFERAIKIRAARIGVVVN